MTRPRINPGYTWFELEIIASPIHRWGVIAKEDIPRNRPVIEYTGVLLNRRQAAARPDQEHCYSYLVDPRGYWTLDATTKGSGAERINHSCDPNLRAHTWHEDEKKIVYYSRRPIKAGEELTVDYHFDWDPKNQVKCTCGSPKCRGTINDPAWKNKRKRKS
jgi:SET domain-containing protein